MDTTDKPRKRAPGGGRKKEIDGEVYRMSVRVPLRQMPMLAQIGNGNASAGVRALIDAAEKMRSGGNDAV